MLHDHNAIISLLPDLRRLGISRPSNCIVEIQAAYPSTPTMALIFPQDGQRILDEMRLRDNGRSKVLLGLQPRCQTYGETGQVRRLVSRIVLVAR